MLVSIFILSVIENFPDETFHSQLFMHVSPHLTFVNLWLTLQPIAVVSPLSTVPGFPKRIKAIKDGEL